MDSNNSKILCIFVIIYSFLVFISSHFIINICWLYSIYISSLLNKIWSPHTIMTINLNMTISRYSGYFIKYTDRSWFWISLCFYISSSYKYLQGLGRIILSTLYNINIISFFPWYNIHHYPSTKMFFLFFIFFFLYLFYHSIW